MNFNPDIFKAYDIRGIYGKDFDEDFAFRLGAALVIYLNRHKFLVAHDDRSFSNKLSNAFMHGIISSGGDVESLDRATTPFFNFVFNELGMDGGTIVTASHDPVEYGGFKIFGERNKIIGLESGLAQLKDTVIKGKFEVSKSAGRISRDGKSRMIEKYIDFIINKANLRGQNLSDIKIKMNVPMLAQEEVSLLLKRLNLQVTDGGHDVMFSFDADDDRINVFDSSGNPVPSDIITVLLAKSASGFWRKPSVVCDFRFSRGVKEKLKKWGIKTVVSRAGRAYMKESMVRHRADIGGELSGHIFWKEVDYNEMPLLTMLRILKIISKTGESIDKLSEPFQTWFNSGEINISFEISKFPSLATRLKDEYHDGKINELDGVMVEYDDPADSGVSWWFNVRPSNTEPMIRLVVEAKTKNLLDEKIAEIKSLIRG